jgi:hypothetical protein
VNLLDYIKAANAALFKKTAPTQTDGTAPTTGAEQQKAPSGWFSQILNILSSTQWSPPGWFPAKWGGQQ